LLQTLFTIPRELAGVPLAVWLFGVWGIVSVISVWRLASAHGLSRALAESWTSLLMTGVAIWILPRLMGDAGLPIRGYGVMLLLAIVSGVGLSMWRAQRVGMDPEIILSLAMWVVVSGIIGARLFYVIEYWHTYRRESPIDMIKAIVNVTQGGLVVYGSLLAGGAATVVFIYKHKLPGFVLTDLITPGVILGMAIGRLGCFLNGCCYGGECDLPWAIRFPYGSPPFVEQASEGKQYLHGLRFKAAFDEAPIIESVEADSESAKQGLKPGDEIVAINNLPVKSVGDANLHLLEIRGGVPVEIRIRGATEAKTWTSHIPLPRSNPIHPAQLYSAIDAFLLCLFLLAWDPYRKREGELTALLLTLHPISRFLLEIIRVDESAVFGTTMSISQNISLGILAGAVVCWIVVLSRPKGLWKGQLTIPGPGLGNRKGTVARATS
jgi:phosphatidylglycerol---prolipoprotein diacylglyceryl transferase